MSGSYLEDIAARLRFGGRPLGRYPVFWTGEDILLVGDALFGDRRSYAPATSAVFKVRKQGETTVATLTGERSSPATFVYRWRAEVAGTYAFRLEMQALGQQAIAEGVLMVRASLMDGGDVTPPVDEDFVPWVDSEGTPWLLAGVPIVQPI